MEDALCNASIASESHGDIVGSLPPTSPCGSGRPREPRSDDGVLPKEAALAIMQVHRPTSAATCPLAPVQQFGKNRHDWDSLCNRVAMPPVGTGN
jgi:hypothetical protein